MTKRLTVAIPTHNRSRLLAATLLSVAAQKIPSEAKVECLVVDNASTDDTGAVVDRAIHDAPFAIRRVIEPHLGSSFARNRAVDEATGDYILFIDDDALAEPDWAAMMLAEIERRNLDAACGAVLPRWTTAPPQWLGPSLYVRLAVHDELKLATGTPSSFEIIHNYFSANVCFKRTTFERFGRFREDLGVVGGNPISGEDTELFERIRARGGAMGFVAAARVHHVIGQERMTRAYLRRKAFAFGVGTAITGGRNHNRLDKLVRNAVRMALSMARGDTEGAIRHELECANFLGYWRGRLGARLSTRPAGSPGV